MEKRKQLGDLLVEAGIITVKTLERALARQKGSGKRLGALLEEMGIITEDELIEALARQFTFKTVMNIASIRSRRSCSAWFPKTWRYRS
jgi:hypothetical protein